MLEGLKGTPQVDLLQERHVKNYLHEYSEGGSTPSIDRLEIVRSVPRVWRMVEKLSPDFILVCTPDIRISNYLRRDLCEHWGFAGVHYKNGSGRMLICFRQYDDWDFQSLVNDTGGDSHRWVDTIRPEDLPTAYSLLFHVRDSVNDLRDGNTTQNAAWIAHQRKHLLPVLGLDISHLTTRMNDIGIALPDLPTTQTETTPSNTSVYDAHRRFFRPTKPDDLAP